MLILEGILRAATVVTVSLISDHIRNKSMAYSKFLDFGAITLLSLLIACCFWH